MEKRSILRLKTTHRHGTECGWRWGTCLPIELDFDIFLSYKRYYINLKGLERPSTTYTRLKERKVTRTPWGSRSLRGAHTLRRTERVRCHMNVDIKPNATTDGNIASLLEHRSVERVDCDRPPPCLPLCCFKQQACISHCDLWNMIVDYRRRRWTMSLYFVFPNLRCDLEFRSLTV